MYISSIYTAFIHPDYAFCIISTIMASVYFLIKRFGQIIEKGCLTFVRQPGD